MATVTIRPSSTTDGFYDGAWTIVTGTDTGTAGVASSYIDEAVADDTGYIRDNDTVGSTPATDLNRQSVPLGDMPAASAISSVVLWYRARSNFNGGSITPFIRSASTDYDQSAQSLTSSFADYSVDITSVLTWTDTLVNGLEIGWRKTAFANNEVRVSQAWVVVTYTASAGGVTVDLSGAGGDAIGDTAGPTVVRGSISITPATADGVGFTNGPTVIRGSIAFTPAAADAIGDTAGPTVTRGSIALTPASADAIGDTGGPTVILGSISITPAAADALGYTSGPSVTEGGAGDVTIDLSGALGDALGDTAGPTVVRGSLSLTPASADALGDTAGPTVVRGSITLTPAAADAIGDTTAPTVLHGSITYTPPASDGLGYTTAPSVVLGSITITLPSVDGLGYTSGPTVTVGGAAVVIVLPLSSTIARVAGPSSSIAGTRPSSTIAGSRPTSTLATP